MSLHGGRKLLQTGFGCGDVVAVEFVDGEEVCPEKVVQIGFDALRNQLVVIRIERVGRCVEGKFAEFAVEVGHSLVELPFSVVQRRAGYRVNPSVVRRNRADVARFEEDDGGADGDALLIGQPGDLRFGDTALQPDRAVGAYDAGGQFRTAAADQEYRVAWFESCVARDGVIRTAASAEEGGR